MKIAVDFDGTLEFEYVQNYVKKLIDEGNHVEIVTTRWDENNKWNYPFFHMLSTSEQEHIHLDLYEIAKKLNIPYNFTNMEYKAKFLEENGFEMLIDDNPDEKKKLNENITFIQTDKINYEE